MMKVVRIFKDYRESGALSALVGVDSAIDDYTFLLKNGGLMSVIAVNGIDDECLDASEIDRIARRFEGAVRVLDENVRLYQYLIKRNNASISARSYRDPVLQKVISSRLGYLQAKADNLYSLEIYFVIVCEDWKPNGTLPQKLRGLLKTPIADLGEMFSWQRKASAIEADLEQARENLARKVMSFVVQLPDGLRARVLKKDEAYGFLHGLLNYSPYKAGGIGLKYDRFVDFQLCDSTLECHQDHLRLDDFYVQALTLKEPPSQTFAHLLGRLQEIPCNFILTSEWKRESAGKIRRLIQSKRRHFFNVKSSMMNYLAAGPQNGPKDTLIDDSAVARVADLGACLEEIEVKGHAFGQFALTIALYSEDRPALKHAVAECWKVFAAHDAQLTEERYNLLNAWLAVLPGNNAYNLRNLWLLDNNHADLSFLFKPNTGEIQNAHLGAEYLAVLESDHGTPYFLNLHHQDVAHSVVIGATGAGKSFALNFLIAQLQKYNPITTIFDLGGSYKNLTALFGGAYLPVGIAKSPVTINPFAVSPTPENLHFLFGFVRVLVESDAFRLTTQDERELYEQIENIYAVEPAERRLSTLANMLNRRLHAPLEKWVEGGPLASVFDNVEDNLTFNRFQTFDFEGMEKFPQVIEAFLFYILHRGNASIYDPAQAAIFKVFVCDEAWRFLRHPTIKHYILEALKTWRKKNAAMILATQSTDDLLRSEMLQVVVESCPTKMFLANPDMDQAAWRDIFHLNEREASLIADLIPKKQILIKRPDGSKVVNLNVSQAEYELYTSGPQSQYEIQARRES